MKRNSGFTLIELLIVVAIIGILAAIAIPNLIEAIERARQKRSVGDIRAMVIGMQSFAVDYGSYPGSARSGDPSVTLPPMNDGGQPAIVPTVIQSIPARDGWQVPYQYVGGPDNLTDDPRLAEKLAAHFVVYSLGSDMATGGGTDGSGPADLLAAGWCGSPQTTLGVRDTRCYQSDIVWGDSSFVQSPEGKQKAC